ncbi:MAG: HAMP domain-containing protein, partial [Bdellovibrio sp.]
MAVIFLSLTWIEFKLFEVSRSLPYVHSIFFFGLVNFNIILFLLLIFLIFRNVVKNLSERQGGKIGSSLKSKLIAAFVGFSFVPTALMFLVSVFYINNSFEKWFSEKMSGVLKSSLEVSNAYYISTKKKNYHFAEEIKKALEKTPTQKLSRSIQLLRAQYSLDGVEIYEGLSAKKPRIVSLSPSLKALPPISPKVLRRVIQENIETSLVQSSQRGNLIRVIVPFQNIYLKGAALVLSTHIPLSLISKMDDIALAYEEYRSRDPLALPLKSIYLIILVLMTLVILLAATWFGFFLAKQLSIPLEELAQATKKIAKGKYPVLKKYTAYPEINILVSHFNNMSRHLEKTEKEVKR